MLEPKWEQAADYRNSWFKHFSRWQTLHWIMIISITGGSAAVASTALKDHHDKLALIVAILGAIYTALNPSQRAEAYREAWVGLNTAVLEGGTPERVVLAYKMGEEIIGRRTIPKRVP